MKLNKGLLLLLSFTIIFCVIQCRNKAVEQSYTTVFPGEHNVPLTLQNEHDSLLTKLREITLFDDTVGILAAQLFELMEHHFSEEEILVFPQLALLPSLAGEMVPENAGAFMDMSEKFKSQLAHMSAEHQMIKFQMTELIQAATEKERPVIISFMQEVERHASAEEEIYFPAAILVGEYLKLKTIN